MTLYLLVKMIIAFGILNVWIIRFNKKTAWRGGDSLSLKEEFQTYGLPIWFMYMVGFMKISLSLIIITGTLNQLFFGIENITIIKLDAYIFSIMGILMIGAILMHLQINDPLKKSLPAISILILVIYGVVFSTLPG